MGGGFAREEPTQLDYESKDPTLRARKRCNLAFVVDLL